MNRIAALACCVASAGCAEPVAVAPSHRGLDAPRGMALALFGPAHERRGLSFPPDPCELAERGANTVLLPVLLEQWGLGATELHWSREGVDHGTLRRVVRRAHACRLQVVLTPLVEIHGGDPSAWRGRIRPRDRDAWWRSYSERVLTLASLAELERAEGLVVSHELSSLSSGRDLPRWRELVRRTRGVFGGRLIAVVNHDALDAELPWVELDRVGVSAYFPLTDDLDAEPEALAEGWRRAGRRLHELSERLGRPITLYEVGYPSLDGGATRPWDGTLGAPVDLVEQERAYEAAVNALETMSFIDGAIFWIWGGPGGPHDRGFTPRDKPAEPHLLRWLSGSSAVEPTPRGAPRDAASSRPER